MERVQQWSRRAVSAVDALAVVSSGMTIFVHGAAATPTPLLDALAARRDLEQITLYHLPTGGPRAFSGRGLPGADPLGLHRETHHDDDCGGERAWMTTPRCMGGNSKTATS